MYRTRFEQYKELCEAINDPSIILLNTTKDGELLALINMDKFNNCILHALMQGDQKIGPIVMEIIDVNADVSDELQFVTDENERAAIYSKYTVGMIAQFTRPTLPDQGPFDLVMLDKELFIIHIKTSGIPFHAYLSTQEYQKVVSHPKIHDVTPIHLIRTYHPETHTATYPSGNNSKYIKNGESIQLKPGCTIGEFIQQLNRINPSNFFDFSPIIKTNLHPENQNSKEITVTLGNLILASDKPNKVVFDLYF